MCGINGFNFEDKNLLTEMNKTTDHRGPDATGTFFNINLSLGHNRLSILDLSPLGKQPMHSFDNKYTLVFNGEIYNFQELKKELATFYPFKSKSDTEVILAGFHKWGKEIFKKLNGIFALAIYDKEKNELLLARDRSGIKPLYYFHQEKKFIFSSEIKAILKDPKIKKKVNHEAFNTYLKINFTLNPATIFEDIKKLEPGFFLTLNLKNNTLQKEKFYEESLTNFLFNKNSPTENKIHLKNLISETVKRQMVADVGVGIFLSGGIDSTIILNEAIKNNPHIETFTSGYDLTDKEESNKFNIDFQLAKKTANFYGSNHNELLITSDDILNNIEETIYQMDEPIAHPTAVPMNLLAKMTRKKVTVILTGDGGDELFLGYERYRLSLISSYYQKLPNTLRSQLNNISKLKKLNRKSGIDRFEGFWLDKFPYETLINKNFYESDTTKNLFKERYFSEINNDYFETQMARAERNSWLTDFHLTLADKMCMINSIENRVPLLDNEVIDFALKIPQSQKISLFNKKIILKSAFEKELPDFILNKPKHGWISPGAKWLRHEKFKIFAREILSEQYNSKMKEVFNFKEINKILENHLTHKSYHLNQLWLLLTFMIWAKKYNAEF